MSKQEQGAASAAPYGAMNDYVLRAIIRKAFDECMAKRLDTLAAQRELDKLIREAESRGMGWTDGT